MVHRPMAECTAEQLVVEAAALCAMAVRANTLEAKRALEHLAARCRELAARRAVLACLEDDDPAVPMLADTIERLIKDLREAQPTPVRRQRLGPAAQGRGLQRRSKIPGERPGAGPPLPPPVSID